MITQEEVNEAIESAKKLNLASLVGEHEGFIILAQDEEDYKTKIGKINRSDRRGFYTAHDFLPKNKIEDDKNE